MRWVHSTSSLYRILNQIRSHRDTGHVEPDAWLPLTVEKHHFKLAARLMAGYLKARVSNSPDLLCAAPHHLPHNTICMQTCIPRSEALGLRDLHAELGPTGPRAMLKWGVLPATGAGPPLGASDQVAHILEAACSPGGSQRGLYRWLDGAGAFKAHGPSSPIVMYSAR